ncbi:MAG: CYCXC family (seleno)protein [Gemmatimonadota bacterium]
MGRGKRASYNPKNRKRGWQDSGWVWLGGAVVLLGVLILPILALSAADHHPEPREHIAHDHVAPATHYAAYPRVAQTYAAVAEIPHVIDGIYCYCACSEHSGHYSLLDCYKDAHAARCDVCLSEASMAYRMNLEGRSLDDIRKAIDRLYET